MKSIPRHIYIAWSICMQNYQYSPRVGLIKYGVLEIKIYWNDWYWCGYHCSKAQRHVVNFKSVSAVVLKTLSGGPFFFFYTWLL